jgi:hypothetical protein
MQMYSLPYTFSDEPVFRTIDLIDELFNYSEEEKEIEINLPIALEPLWYGLTWLSISFVKNQRIPILFLRTLQSPHSQSKMIKLCCLNTYKSLL